MKSTALLLLTLVACSQSPTVSAPAPVVVPLKAEHGDGCGCAFVDANDKIVYWNEAGTDVAWMNVDGVDTELKRKGEPPSGLAAVGDKGTERFEAGALQVSLGLTVTSVCKPDDEECESTGFNAAIAVTRDAQTTQVVAHGSCGC